MGKSPALFPAVLLTCAVFGLFHSFCFAQDEIASARLDPIPFAADANASASPSLPADTSGAGPRRIGVGAKISLLGIGGEAAVAVTRRINVRGGFNGFSYSRDFDKDGINYAGKLAFRSGEAHFDFFPFAGGFHLSPGLLFYNGNHIDAVASAPANQSFTLGGVTYTSSSTNPVNGTAKIDFNKVAPTFLIGFGNLIPRSRRRFSFNFELGAAYTGAPRASLNLQGSACTTAIQAGKPVTTCVNAATDPTVQSNVQSEVAKVNHDVSVVKFYPLISFGFGLNF